MVAGIVHAKQDYLRDTEARARVIPILLHGDAAFTGQGVVMETLGTLRAARSIAVGGTIHIIVNNQVGFTTSPEGLRVSPAIRATSPRSFNAPVFHVNADDPEAVIQAARLAIEFRDQFKEDVIIDLVCYRRHGHNELDDPTFTQPLMYKRIREKRPVHRDCTQSGSNSPECRPRAERTRSGREIRETFENALGYARDEMPRAEDLRLRRRMGRHGLGRQGLVGAYRGLAHALLERVIVGATTIPEDFQRPPESAQAARRASRDARGRGQDRLGLRRDCSRSARCCSKAPTCG